MWIPPSSRGTDDVQNLPVIGPKSPVLKHENTTDCGFDRQGRAPDGHIVAGSSRGNEPALPPHDNPEEAQTHLWIVRWQFLPLALRDFRWQVSCLVHPGRISMWKVLKPAPSLLSNGDVRRTTCRVLREPRQFSS